MSFPNSIHLISQYVNLKHGLECSFKLDFNPTCEAEASIAKHVKDQLISG